MSDKQIKKRRILLVVFITILFGICFIRMNKRFDRLSRYPYDNPEKRALIDKHLNDDEIEYIIEYSIEPNYFIKFIQCKNFNIYHVDFYQDVNQKAGWIFNDNQDIVDLCENALQFENGKETTLSMLPDYSASEILYWLRYKDLYDSEANIVLNVNDVETEIKEHQTLSTYVPKDLVLVDDLRMGKGFYLREEAYNSLKEFCNNAKNDIGGACGFYRLDSAYVSYDDQKKRFEKENTNECQKEYPGHDEHQLGLCIDLSVQYGLFEGSTQEKYFNEHCYEYGFIPTDIKYHFRYVGKAKALLIQETAINDIGEKGE